MKKKSVWILLLFVLTGCSRSSGGVDTGMQLRTRMLQSSQCSFTADITADYGVQLSQFTIESTVDMDGNLTFTVVEPSSIHGISGTITGEGGELTFDDFALYFPLLADDLLSPISAPWIMTQAIRSGYLASSCVEDNQIRLSIDDTYDNEPLRLDIWLNDDQKPSRADILYDGRRILTLTVSKFEIS